MHAYEEIKNMLCEELEKIAQKGELTAGSLDIVDKLTHSIKSLETIIAMKDYTDDYSNGYDDGNSNRYYDGRYYPRYSYRRGRDSMGRYTSRGGRYSRAEAHDEIIKELHDIMNSAQDEAVKSEIKKAVKKIEEM
jgi:hypothetical protein